MNPTKSRNVKSLVKCFMYCICFNSFYIEAYILTYNFVTPVCTFLITPKLTTDRQLPTSTRTRKKTLTSDRKNTNERDRIHFTSRNVSKKTKIKLTVSKYLSDMKIVKVGVCV